MPQTKYIISLVDRVTRMATKMGRSLDTLSVHAKKASTAINTVGLLAGGLAVAGVFKLGAELESTKLKFDTLTGSAEKGKKLFDELTEFANKTPFSNQALNKNASTLLAFGADAEKVTKTLKMLGDISAGDQNRLQSLTLAFAQSRSAGRLMGQDLLQMVNVGFNPLQIISEKTGKSMMELKKEMEKGLISFDLVERAFESATAQGGRFHNLTTKMADTMAGKWSTVMGKGKFAIAKFGLALKSAFLPHLNKAVKMIDKFSDFIDRNKDQITKWGKLIIDSIPTLLGLIVALKIFNAVASANPYVALIFGLVALIKFTVELTRNFNDLSATINGFFDKLGAFRLLMLPLEMVWLIFQSIIGIVKSFKTGGFIEGMKQIGKSILSFLILPLEAFLNALSHIGIAKTAFDDIKKFRDQLDFKDIDVDAEIAKKQKAEDLISGLPSLDVADFGALGLDAEAKKLKAEGVVSGGIKTFNINISNITGVETLSTTSIEESSEAVGDQVVKAIIGALGDIRNIG